MKRWIPAVVWMIAIFATSCTVIGSKAFVHGVATRTIGTVTESGFSQFWSSWWWVFVKGYHAFEFGLLFMLLRHAIQKDGLALPAAVFYAASDEFHQTFVPNRGGRVTDVLIDSVGIFVGSVAIAVAKQIKGRRSSHLS